jgi:thioesterase domain-containing protein
METQLVQIWENAFGITPIGIDDDFFELGGHSLLAGRLLTALTQTMGKDLPLASFVEAPTIRQQAALLQRTGSRTEHWRSLVALKPGGNRPPIFAIHASQGTVLFYRHLARYLHPEQPLYGLQQQGINGKRTHLTHLEDMAAHYIDEIRTVQPHGPYHLIGYCDGGTFAFEMAQQLHAQGENVALLAAINAATPDYDFSQDAPVPAEKPETPEAPTAPAPAAQARQSLPRWVSALSGRLRYYRWIAKVRGRRGIARATLALGLTIPMEYRRAYASRVNERAMKQYQIRPYRGRMLVIRGAGLFHDPTTGWQGRAHGGLDLHEIAGHYTLLADIMAEPHVQTLARILEKALVHDDSADVADGIAAE